MTNLIGFATLTFDDGSIFQGQVKLTSLEPSGRGYAGKFETRESFAIRRKLGKPILSVGSVKYRVSVARTGSTDGLTIETFGSQLTNLQL